MRGETMKQHTARRFQNIPQHRNITVRVQFVLDMFKKHNLPLLSDINYMLDIAITLDSMKKSQVDSFRTALSLAQERRKSSHCRVLNDKYSK